MRVLMTADTVGGVFTYTVDLAAGLAARGVEVAVATFGRAPTNGQRRALAQAGVAHVVETELALEWMEEPWLDLTTAERLLLELERDLAPDVVHLNAYAHGGAPFRAPTVVVGHSCVFSWWAGVHRCDPPPGWDRYRRIVRRGLAGADAIVAPSHTMLGELERCYGPLAPATRVILNGSSIREADATGGREPLVIGAGRLWDQAKNVAALQRVAERPGLHGRVLLAGEGDGGHDGAGGARWLGSLAPDELTEVRRRAAVYAAPARYEPFGLGILEAARDGCALVLGDIPSLRELWDGAAMFVAPDDETRLADTLEHLLDDPGSARRWGMRARRRSRAYPAGAMADGYLALYRSLVSRPKAVAA